MSRALIFHGGWDGHQPTQLAERFDNVLRNEGFTVTVTDSLESLTELDLAGFALLVPIWTMGEISPEQCEAVSKAVAGGTGLAGCHGGMCDAFRNSVDWQFITGGQWVSHPGADGVPYTVRIRQSTSPIVAGIRDFSVCSEHYYLHVDPAVEVLATTQFPVVDGPHAANGKVDMPVMWTKRWGRGRVFYSSLGHQNNVFDIPEALETMRRGLLWAAGVIN